jgi:hypothetical protein
MINSQPRVSSIVDTVMMRSHGRWDRPLVLSLVNDSMKTFDDAPLQQFVEVLVEKEVTDELRRIDVLHPVPA